MNLSVSVIIPTYNEERIISRTLEQLGRARGHFEVIVADGESTDGTRSRLEALVSVYPRPLRVITAGRNRSLQLNRAAQLARGNLFLFLHADAQLPPTAIEALQCALRNESIIGGNFHLVYEGDDPWSRFFTWVNHARRVLGIYYGDSGIFIRRSVFEHMGGFKPMPIMEDYEFVRRMERGGPTLCLAPALAVSNRRWRVQGVFRTVFSWVWIQTLYWLGVSPHFLAKWYQPVRSEGRENAARVRLVRKVEGATGSFE